MPPTMLGRLRRGPANFGINFGHVRLAAGRTNGRTGRRAPRRPRPEPMPLTLAAARPRSLRLRLGGQRIGSSCAGAGEGELPGGPGGCGCGTLRNGPFVDCPPHRSPIPMSAVGIGSAPGSPQCWLRRPVRGCPAVAVWPPLPAPRRRMSLKLLSRFMRTRGRASRPSPAGSRLWRDFLLLKGELPAEGVAGKQL